MLSNLMYQKKSSLGPLLFLVFINDIVEDNESNTNIFADVG